MASRLSGQTALVTGAGSGIGRAIALRLGGAGARLVLAGRNAGRLETVASELARTGVDAGGATVHPCDVRDAAAVEALVAAAGTVDILVNGAGVIAAVPVHETDIAAFDEILATNLRGAFLVCRAVLPGMRARRRGVIVNVSSVAARRSFSGMGAYAASKAGLGALSGVIREESRALGIRVVDVIAGATGTDMWDAFWPDAPREKMMAPDDVARAVMTAIVEPGAGMIEELVIRPQGGDL